MLAFNLRYFLLALALFIVEVLIALYVHDHVIRPFVGDYLVVMLMYCAVKAVVPGAVKKVALGVLLFACLVEALQYLNLVHRLGLQGNKLARIVLGSHFDWMDILTYVLGIATVLGLEQLCSRGKGVA
jgi:hypothetical protein